MKHIDWMIGTLGWLWWCWAIVPAIASPDGATAPLSSPPIVPLTKANSTSQNDIQLVEVDQEPEDAVVQAAEPALRHRSTNALQPQTLDLESNTQVSTRAADLKTQSINPSESLLEPLVQPETFKTAEDTIAQDAESSRLSPLERPMTRLFGFETANPLQQGELVLQAGAISFNNPNDFREVLGLDENRSNDAFVGIDYGVTDTLQFSLGLAGKDDTRFSDLVREQSALQFIYGIIPAQIKWQVYRNERLKAAVVGGAEFAAPFGPLFFTGGRQVTFSTPTNPLDPNRNEFRAEDDSVYFSLAAPVSYQLTKQASFHLNPQVSFFPDSIPASQTRGNLAPLLGANVGFNGTRLDYYGTVVGLGLGFNYSFNPRIQFAADITPILAGSNSAGSGEENSLFVNRPVWNVGLRFAPNSRVGTSLYFSNRFGPTAAAPSNLLAQPGGDWGVGLDFTYLPDLTGNYRIEKRTTYPEPQAFLPQPTGFPSTTLPINSTLYQLAFGSNARVNPAVRIGLLDDLELAFNFSYANNTEEIPIEVSAFGRLALVPDKGREFSAAVDIGLTRIDATNRDLDINTFFLYADLPLSYRLQNSGLNFTLTPKLIVPAQFQQLDNIFALTLGASWNLASNTQLMAQFTPILLGDNQLQDSRLPGQEIGLNGKTALYNLGIRQLFPTGNSLYAVDLYLGNSVGDYGFQGISALPNSGTQVGIRFNVLNGVPDNQRQSKETSDFKLIDHKVTN